MWIGQIEFEFDMNWIEFFFELLIVTKLFLKFH